MLLKYQNKTSVLEIKRRIYTNNKPPNTNLLN